MFSNYSIFGKSPIYGPVTEIGAGLITINIIHV